jgi:SAM-dependent methyltransferase
MSFPGGLSQRVRRGQLFAVAQAAYHGLYRASIRGRCWAADLNRPRGLPPAMLRFRVSESISALEFTNVGARCAELVAEEVARTGPFDPGYVLDFGCGCGRSAPHMMEWLKARNPAGEFHGCDVDAEAVAWCAGHLAPGIFRRNQPAPPLPYPDHAFDLVYCISVFTHLAEPLQDRWFEELHRVLRPGGLLVFTVHGHNAARRLSTAEQSTLHQNGLLHKRSRKLRGWLPDWYQTTWHTESYLRARLDVRFEAVNYRVIPDGRQDVVTARKCSAAAIRT